MAKTEKNDKDFALRLPESIFTKIKSQAEKNDRSINWEIVNALKRVFK